MHYFYILRCADNSLYCGQTSNLDRRLKEHNHNKTRGAKYTKAKRPVSLVYFEEFKTLSLAMKREAEVKKLTKVNKEALVDDDNVKLKKL